MKIIPTTSKKYKELMNKYLQLGRDIGVIDHQMLRDKPKRSFDAYRKRQQKRKERISRLQTRRKKVFNQMLMEEKRK